MFVISNLVGSTIQITTLPLPVLSTLQASGLVFNTICATLILGEAFTRWSFGGTALVAGGAILIALYGALPEPTHNLDQLLELIARPQFIVWMLGTFVVIAFVLFLALFLPRLSRFARTHHYQPISQHLHHHQHAHHTSPRVRLLTGMSFGFVSAVLSAHTLLLAKSAVELILTSIPLTRTDPHGTNQFVHYQSYLIILGLIAFALSQLYFLHRGLKLASTSVLYPFVFCIYNIVAILDGLIYFKQTDRLPPLHAGLIALGTVVLLAGVLALSWRLEEQGIQQEREYGIEHPIVPTGQVSALGPGMGLVEDTATESPSGTESAVSDEENGFGRLTESTPLLFRRSSTRAGGTVGFDVSSGARPSSGYSSTSRHRRRGSRGSTLGSPSARRLRFETSIFERENIWRELMDDKEALVSPIEGPLKMRRRRQTILGPPSRPAQQDEDEHSASDGNEAERGPVNGKLRRSKTTPSKGGSSQQPQEGSGEEGEGIAAWKKRRRRPVEPGEGRSVSSPLLGRIGSTDGTGKPRKTVEWVGGLVVSTHDSKRRGSGK